MALPLASAITLVVALATDLAIALAHGLGPWPMAHGLGYGLGQMESIGIFL